jgi:hypothetical protein
MSFALCIFGSLPILFKANLCSLICFLQKFSLESSCRSISTTVFDGFQVSLYLTYYRQVPISLVIRGLMLVAVIYAVYVGFVNLSMNALVPRNKRHPPMAF